MIACIFGRFNINELLQRRVVNGASCPLGEMSDGRVVHGAKCLMGRFAHGAKFPLGGFVHGASVKKNQR